MAIVLFKSTTWSTTRTPQAPHSSVNNL